MTAVPNGLMPAAVCVGDGRVAVEEVPIPEPRPGELLVEVSACGICGSDLHLVFDRYVRPGAILGHEWSGVVASAEGAGAEWSGGERVVSNPTPGCGRCRPCRRGRPSVCLRRGPSDIRDMRGAFAQYMTVSAANTLRIPDSLATRVAALAEPTAIAIHAVELADVGAGDRVLITGGGPVGLTILAVLLARGVTDISVSEPVAPRRRQALAVGAGARRRSGQPRGPGAGQRRLRPLRRGLRVLRPCGHGRGRPRAAGLCRHPGVRRHRIPADACEPQPDDRPRARGPGCLQLQRRGLPARLDLLDSGALPVDLLIEAEDVSLDGLMDAMERLSRGEIPAKVLVNPEVS